MKDMDPRTDDREAIAQTLSEWAEAIRGADMETLAGLVTEDAEFWTHGVAPLTGRDALKEAFALFFSAYGFEQDFDCQELIVSGDLAFMRGTELNRLTPHDGSKAVENRQRAFSILRREGDGRWRFARGMTNLSPE
jgi:uncharacterized protein (TIGR02246 family)